MVRPCTSVSILMTCLVSLHFSLVSANISPGTTLTPSNSNTTTWTSSNGTFSLSFITIPSTNPPSYAAAISYYGIPVWKAGGDSGTINSDGSFQFLQNGNLRLINGNGSVIWESGTANRGITTAILDDSGNLSLKNSSVTVWSSFDNPTDTIVPTQNFTTGMILRSGLYSFNLLNTGNLTLKWNGTIVYWNQALNSTTNPNLTSPSLSIQAIGTVTLNDPTFSAPLIMDYSSDYGEGNDILRFLKLGSDGNFRIYSSARSSGVDAERWAAVSDQCKVFGYCGNMGICHYNDTTPVCGCPSENFVFVDPNDSRKGCQRKVELENCPGNFTMLQLDHTQFLTYPPDLSSQLFTAGISACSSICLRGPCLVSTSLADGTGECYIKPSGFIGGYMSLGLPSTSFVKVCNPVVPNSPPTEAGTSGGNTWKLSPWVVVVVVSVTLLGLILLEGGLWWLCCRNSPNFRGVSAQYALLEYASGAPVQFTYKELQHTTKGFKEKLGAGGFGTVYKGIANRTEVAVKQLEGIEQGEKQFRMEVATISSTHHLNLVRLIGFCSEGRHRLLVYELMKNGSLDNFLFTSEEPSGRFLDWETRFKIALGTARAITYLHEECRDCIVHCDIKPENILLDENYNAKVSDFGLVKLINPKDDRYRTITGVRGTRGYLAPEWLANLPITSKSDVYSYGMVLLEIVSGRRNFEVSEDTGWKKFSLWAYEEFDRGNLENVVDKRLTEHGVDMKQVMQAIQVSFWCIQEQPSQRPMMGKVVHMLEGTSAIEKPPAPKTTAEGSGSGSSMKHRSTVSTLSTFATSVPQASSSSSFQAMEVSSSLSGRNTERTSSSLLQSNRSEPLLS